jgi:hypothetical protein
MNLITIDVPDKPLAIAAIGDIQFTGLDKMQMGCSVDHLKEHLNWLDKGSRRYSVYRARQDANGLQRGPFEGAS